MAVLRSGSLKAASTIVLLAGIWTIITPYALGGSVGAMWNGVVVGILMIICSWGRLANPMGRGFSVANIIWSIWLIISPFALGLAGAGVRWSFVVTGIVALICSWVAVRQIAVVTAFPESGTDTTRRAA